MTSSNSPRRDWLEADESYLPTNQLPLLRSMLGKRLSNIQRFISDSPDTWVGEDRILTKRHDFFRQAFGTTLLELEGLPPIYFIDSYSYALDFDEYSIAVSVTPKRGVPVPNGLLGYQCYTLLDPQHVDDRLRTLIGQHIRKMRILVRAVEYHKDTPRALQDGIEINFDNGTTIILTYMLDKDNVDALRICYPEEVRWEAVQYRIDVAKGRLPKLYRFRRWWWRAIDRAGRRLEHL